MFFVIMKNLFKTSLIISLLNTLILTHALQGHETYEGTQEMPTTATSITQKQKTLTTCEQFSEVWTNWDRMPFGPAIINLANMRDQLNHKNLFDPYKELPQTLSNGKPIECDEHSKKARTDNGTCNNLKSPSMGAKQMAFGRNVPLNKIVRTGEEKLYYPNPVTISQELLERDTFKPVLFLNFLITSWLQFMNHDWVFHGKNVKENPYTFHKYLTTMKTLEEAAENPSSQKSQELYKILIPRTQVDPQLQKERHSSVPENKIYRNAVTHWWDGSQIYGSDTETLKTIRSYKNGKMIIEDEGLLPLGEDHIEKVGFKDNWWVGLSMLHHLFVMEHNSIAEMLQKHYPSWNDQKLYDTARLINAAVMAKIHTVEWTPAILPNPVLQVGMETNWSGALNPKTQLILSEIMTSDETLFLCKEDVNPVLKSLRKLAGSALGNWMSQYEEKADHGENTVGLHPILIGMVGGNTELFDVPYTLTEEFVAVYRMHPLLPEELQVIDFDTGKTEVVPLNETRHEKSMNLIKRQGLKNLFYSFGRTHPGALSLKNYPKFMTNIQVPENPSGTRTIDMAMTDILRDRERGVLRYNNFRRAIGLKPIRKFEDLFMDENRPETFKNLESKENQNLLATLKKVYDNDVEQIDLLVGTLGEQIRPQNFGFGETAFQIFILMATRRLQADRFFTEDYTAEIYTQEGLDWIDTTSMKKVLLRHFPSLNSALEGVKNAFNPWNNIHNKKERKRLKNEKF